MKTSDTLVALAVQFTGLSLVAFGGANAVDPGDPPPGGGREPLDDQPGLRRPCSPSPRPRPDQTSLSPP
ncbi:MAG: hypothetical protein WDM85_11750 [Caulobacteraceae bacterium]